MGLSCVPTHIVSTPRYYPKAVSWAAEHTSQSGAGTSLPLSRSSWWVNQQSFALDIFFDSVRYFCLSQQGLTSGKSLFPE